MAITSKNMSYEHTPMLITKVFSGLDGHPEASTDVSGGVATVVAASGPTVAYADRWEVMEYSNAANDMAVWNCMLPEMHFGTGVDVEVKYTGTSGGNFRILAGLTSTNSGSIYGIVADTVYYNETIPAPSLTGDILSQSFSLVNTFGPASTPVVGSAPIAFLLVRLGSDGADTNTGTLDVLSVNFKWYEDAEGTLL